MENASKALIIAGAILIAILLIGIGVGLINALNNPMDTATDQLSSQTKQMVNSKFEGYVGRQSGANILSLISEIRSYNTSNSNGNFIAFSATNWKDAKGQDVTDCDAENASQLGNLANATSNVVRAHTYTVSVQYGTDATKANYGLISQVTVAYN